MPKYDLLRIPLLRKTLESRWPQLILRAAALGGFAIAILAGLLGTRVGNHNFAIVVVWIAWWAALMLLAVPLLGRGWCAICPIPMPGEWLQNGAALGPVQDGSRHGRSLKRFPKSFRNIWMQNVAFTLLALFSAVILTRPSVTGWILLGMLLVAVGASLVYERRTFCRYICPVGGFIGLYSQLAPLELRVVDTKICAAHKEKSCYRGNAEGYGCPWDVFPGGLAVNTNCGLCMECLRTCEYDNIALNLRAPGADLDPPHGLKLDEAYKAFIMLGSALVYSAVMLGPWGALKTAAYSIGSPAWWGYALGLLVLIWGLLPGLFYLTTRAAQALAPVRLPPRKLFARYAAALIPLGLTAWIAFSISFVFANISYLWPVLSDPFGWGWDLFGTAGAGWTPYLSLAVPMLQVVVLLGGLFWSGRTAAKIAAEQGARRHVWPVTGFNTLVTIGLLWLLVG
ncbi:MAG: 4Fe-4S binding protein [Chloroflexi bacterium]|nr:4Fe-4S binding protein [Chloroflexota bacterium]